MAALLQPLDPDAANGWAQRLIDHLGTLPRILSSSEEVISRVTGTQSVGEHLVIVHAVFDHVLHAPLLNRPVLKSFDLLITYLTNAMAHAPTEQVRALFLDSSNRLIRDELISAGSANSVELDVRKILRRTLELDATALIVVHNHPSGDPTPSWSDKEATRRLVEIARGLGVRVHDHLIVAASGYSSMHQMGLM